MNIELYIKKMYNFFKIKIVFDVIYYLNYVEI